MMVKPLNQKARELIGSAVEDAATPTMQPMVMPDRDLTGHSTLGPSVDPKGDLVEGYAFNECCPSFAPGWEVDDFQAVDPCPWQADLMLCYSTCFWTAQVPDNNEVGSSPTAAPTWLDRCGRIQSDWRNLCVIPDTR
jgi:hypothetical protein